MFPKLFENITAGTVPQNNGLGVLSDCLSCKVTQERNGAYELVMEYPASGLHAEEIATRRIIMAKPNFTDAPQLFRINRIGKVLNGKFTVYASHISYDLSGYEITSGSAGTAVAACALLQSTAPGYTITTDKTVTASFEITEPSSVRSWFGGKSGSFLDVFGTSEIKYDNFNIQFKLHAGQDRGVTIRYGKNLLELSQEISDTLVTHVLCFWKDENTTVIGSKVSTGLVLDVPKTLIIDCSGDYENAPTNAQLTAKATAYVNSHNLTTPSNNIKLDFVQSGELTDRVDLCDTVSIYYEALGITRAQVKCIKTVWDVLREKYIETEFGDATTNLADSIVGLNKEVENKPSVSFLENAVDKATKLITGNLGGYVVIHDSNGDGEPDEILIMNTPDISTATKVWRWNQNGLGYSSTGYSGTYGLAMTADGEIVADFITAGTMSGNRVRTGLITSTNNQLILDLDNGTITAPSITLNGQDVESTIDSLVQTSVVTRYALSNSGTTIPSTFPLTSPTTPTEQQPYLWARTVYTYASGETNTSYSISVRGANGADGADGAGLAILGNYDSMADLIADHPTGSAGEAYMVGTDLVVWNTNTNSWENVGRIQGPSGSDALWLAIDNDDNGSNMNITYTAHLFKGLSTDVTQTFDAVFVWQRVNESGVVEIASNTPTITVSRDLADYGSTIRCICIAIVDEEVLQDYNYNAIQDYTNNDIQIISANNVKLIGEAAVYKPYAISSQFQVLSDEISSRVTQTTFDSLSDTVTEQGTLIQQNADAILLKADTTTVDAGLNNKMGKDMSNRSSSILIDSGQIRFDSNSLVVNSSKFTLDNQGNATFSGNLSAATIDIGGTPVDLGDAIDDAEAGAISAAAADATTKANNAVNTAAADATAKANSALASANSYTNTGLAGKVGNNEVRTKFAADNHSITIQSGTVNFKSNTLLIDSTQFTLDAQGNATFKGNLSAATLVIGGETTNIGTAIGNAESDAIATASADATTKATNAKNQAISAAATDATTKANNAKSQAISTAAADATSKADSAKSQAITAAASDATTKATNAKNQAISTAASDATTKANTAQSNAIATSKSYTDTGLAGKVGNNEIRTKFAADTHSIAIESGTIAFRSNTLSVDSSNLKITNDGFVTSRIFKAKEEFQMQDANGIARGSISFTTNDNIILWFFKKNDINTVFVRLYGTEADGGMFGLYNHNGDMNVFCNGRTGIIECVHVNETSSRKVKENIEPMTDEDAEKILELQAVSFDYKNKDRGTDQRGFIAEDVAEVLPNLVNPETEEHYASLNYTGMIPYLQQVVKMQAKTIKELEARLTALESKIK